MSTASNELPASAVEVAWVTGPSLMLVEHNTARTPTVRRLDALTVVSVSQDSEIAGWVLKSVLIAQVRRTRKQSVATTWLEGFVEYGTGKTDSEAMADLVISLGEYRESLERREGKLGESAKKELEHLRRLIEHPLAYPTSH